MAVDAAMAASIPTSKGKISVIFGDEEEIDHGDEEEHHEVPRNLESIQRVLVIGETEPHNANNHNRQRAGPTPSVGPEDQQKQPIRHDEDGRVEESQCSYVEMVDETEDDEDQIGEKDPCLVVLGPQPAEGQVPVENCGTAELAATRPLRARLRCSGRRTRQR